MAKNQVELSKILEGAGLIILFIQFLDAFFKFLGTLDQILKVLIVVIVIYLIIKKKVVW